jgi:hypothetical protein
VHAHTQHRITKELKQELKGLFLGKEPRNSDRAERRQRRERDQLIAAQENGPRIPEDYPDAAAGPGRERNQPTRSPDERAPSKNRQPRELSDEDRTPTNKNPNETEPNLSYVSELIRGDSSDKAVMKPVERKQIPSSEPEREEGSSITELERISRNIRRIQIEHPDIHFEWDIQPPCQLSDVEMALRSLLSSYQSIYEDVSSWEKKTEKLEVDYKALETKSKDDLNRRNNDLAELVSMTNKEKSRLENELSAVKDLLATQNLEHDGRIKQIQGDYQSQRNSFLSQVKHLNEQLEEMRRKNSSLERETSIMANRLAGIEQRHGEDIMQIRGHHQLELKTTIENNNRQIQQLRSEMAVWARDHEEEISQLKKGHEEELIIKRSAFGNDLARRDREHTANTSRMETEQRTKMRAKEEEVRRAREGLHAQLKITEEQLAQAEEAKNKEIERIRKENAAEKTRIGTEYQDKVLKKEEEVRGVREELHTQVRITEEQVDQAVEARDKEIERMRKEHKYMITAKAEEIEKIRKVHEAEIVTVIEAHASDKAKMEEEHARDKIHLRKDVEDLKGALVKREHSKAMSDREAAQLFQDIGEEIDSFARVQWDEKYKLTWPFPEKSIQKSENIRRTKQYIIQNTLWIILYEKIFCTPFRVLGDEGKSLEDQWVEEFGRGKLL